MSQNVPKTIWLRSLWRRSAYGAITFSVVIAIACCYFRVRSTRDISAYVGMALECHPVWRDLALRRVRLGQPIEEVIAATEPISIDRHGRFVELGFEEALSFTGIHILAMDGKLVRACAGSCTWDYTFFDAMHEADWATYSASLEHDPRTVEYMGTVVSSPMTAGNVEAAAVD